LQPKELGLVELEVRVGQGKVTVQAERWGTVAAVKEKCKCTNEVLALEGHELDDARILASYSLRSGSILHLLPSLIQIYIKPLEGQTFPLTLCLSDTIAKMKEKIESQEGVPKVVQRLLIGAEVLSDAKTLAEHSISRNMTIRLVVVKPENCTVS